MRRLTGVLEQIGLPYEIILVNDGSRDASWERIVALGDAYKRLRGINLSRNYGQHNALLAGIRAATGDVIITIDDDLQHPPEEIPKLLAKLAEGYDVVYGTPERQQHGLWRDLASLVTKFVLQGAMGAEVARSAIAFRAFRTQIRDAFAAYHNPFISIDVLLTYGTTRFAAVIARHEPRQMGKTNYTFRKLVTHTLNMMTGFSTAPLQLASLIGFSFTLFGLGVLAFVLIRYLMSGGSIPGFPFLVSIIVIFSGSQLLALGIIGEYLSRMHVRMMDRPPYIIRTQTGRDALTDPDGIEERQYQSIPAGDRAS
ncbi:MAG: glycosyltransferase family 2 protein [Chloroflexota bacterium]|nr:glycosyltransferase family 2 protein [Chloroflexota bacterium]